MLYFDEIIEIILSIKLGTVLIASLIILSSSFERFGKIFMYIVTLDVIGKNHYLSRNVSTFQNQIYLYNLSYKDQDVQTLKNVRFQLLVLKTLNI